jgi:dUTP pyrophosphatase
MSLGPLTLGYFRLAEDVHFPIRVTSGSACFDLCAYLGEGGRMLVRDAMDEFVSVVEDRSITLTPWSRVLIPTGLIFDIPMGYSVRIHPRSGLAFKQGLILANQEGIVDNDYKEEVFIPVLNNTGSNCLITDGQRIAQAELVRDESYGLLETTKRPGRITERAGGFGSTG